MGNLEKFFIKNRKGQKMAVMVEKVPDQKGLAFVMHGLGGNKEQNHIATFAKAFQEKGFTVVRFDTTNTFGESDGNYENATITNYYEDLGDVIEWAKSQSWYQEPFALSGHSLGGICTTLYAENYPTKVLALAPISPVVSGQLRVDAKKRFDPEGIKKWEETGWQEEKGYTEIIKRLPWSHIEDNLKYDLLPYASKLTMPVLLIVGENDTSTPPDQIQKLYDALPEPKEIHIIKGAPHTFRDPAHLKEIHDIFSNWIDSF